MNRSESIANLAAALVQFNTKVTSIAKNAKNPQFRSEYVTLDELIRITRPILKDNGLAIMQFPLTKETGEIGVQTLLMHNSGEFIESEPIFMTPVRMVKGGGYETAKDPQAAGSLISYLRRYSYQAILNLNTGEDDDGNEACNAGNGAPIGKVEVQVIEKLIDELKIDKMAFMTWAKVQDISQITIKNFPIVMKMLDRKKEELGKGDK